MASIASLTVADSGRIRRVSLATHRCRFHARVSRQADDVGQGETAIAVAVLRTPAGLQSLGRGEYVSGNFSTRQASSARSEAIADQYVAAPGPGGEAFRFLSASWSRMTAAASVLAPPASQAA